MRILLLENKQLLTTILPTRVEGNYWITNENNKNLLNIEAIDGKWILKSNKEVKLIKDETIDNEIASTISSLEIIPGKMYYCQDMNTETIYKIY